MSWHYYNKDREKIGPFTNKELKQLIRRGVVTPDTRFEAPNGNTALAKNVAGLPFPEKGDGPVVASNSIPVLLKKAEAGDAGAMLELAYAYNKIENFSPEDVFFWIEKAAKLGNTQAQFELSGIYRSEDIPLYDLKESLH